MSERRTIAVAGHGMVGARFVEDLLGRADPGSVQVQVFGAEGYQPYNRVLLSEVVAGRADPRGLTLPTPDSPDLQVHRSVPVRAVDRTAMRLYAAGTWHDYDELVLATGAHARIPQIPGLMPNLPAGAHVLRTLDDARDLVAAAAVARSVTVLGGGLLGLEVACALVRRGADVRVLHHGSGPMDRQLDEQAGGVLAGALGRLGARVLCRTRTTAVLTSAGRVQEVVAEVDGRRESFPTDLLVLACGTVVDTGLASAAGLAVDRGVLVGADLTTRSDAHVHAVGDCAQPPEGASGLIGQGWRQAGLLAERLAIAPPPRRRIRVTRPRPTADQRHRFSPTPGSDVVRLKAAGLDVVTLGPAHRDAEEGDRTVTLSDPTAGRHLAATVRDGVLVAATCIGAPEIAADLTAGYTRRTPAPADPVHLLIRPLARPSAPADPGDLPEDATVCSCNSVSKARIVSSWRTGARSQDAIARATRATTGCGGCTDQVCGLLTWLEQNDAGSTGSTADSEKYDIRLKPPVHHAEIAAE